MTPEYIRSELQKIKGDLRGNMATPGDVEMAMATLLHLLDEVLPQLVVQDVQEIRRLQRALHLSELSRGHPTQVSDDNLFNDAEINRMRLEVHHTYRCACPTVLGDDVQQAIDCAFRQREHERREQRECPDCTETQPCARVEDLIRG